MTAIRASGRRLAHLVSRFFASLRAQPLDAATVAWVAGVLEPAELRAFDGMDRADQAEAVYVARRLDRALAGTTDAGEARWTAAALLHDVGKQQSGYGTFGRTAVTAIAIVAGDARVRGWATSASGPRARMGRYAAHDELGAERLERDGARPEVAAWAAAHHRPERWSATGIPASVCRALADADGEPA